MSRVTTPSGLSRPRAALFDWDNTLVDNWVTIREALNATLVAMGHAPWSVDETMARVRASMRDSFPKMFGDRWPEARRIFFETFEARHLETLREMEGARDLLDALGNRGVYLAVVSNKQGRFLRREADRLGWTALFGRLIGAGDASQDKPAVEPVELALAGSGVGRGGEVWFVGDTEMDMECAHAAGCMPLLIRPEPLDPRLFAGRLPAWHGAGCLDLARLVEEL